jgi:hypothetical protein
MNKREDRKKQTAEVFTPQSLVNEMMDKLSFYAKNPFKKKSKTFLDPACGNGNFLINVLKRKMKNGISGLDSLKSIYGADLMPDNIIECHLRLLQFIASQNETITRNHCETVIYNVVNTDSLQWDFSFDGSYISHTLINKYLEIFTNGVVEVDSDDETYISITVKVDGKNLELSELKDLLIKCENKNEDIFAGQECKKELSL